MEFWETFGPKIGPKRRSINLSFSHHNPLDNTLTLDIFVSDSSLQKLNHPSDVLSILPSFVRSTMESIFNVKSLDYDLEDDADMIKPDIDALYEAVKMYHDEHVLEENIDPQHKSLLPNLRPYQKRAVVWMMSKEKEKDVKSDELHPLFVEVDTEDGTPLYYNRFGGFLVKEKPKKLQEIPGGILADEMGLGKTVEVLSLMLCHPRENIPRPDFKEPIKLTPKVKRKSRRRRSPSPVEFFIKEEEEEKVEPILTEARAEEVIEKAEEKLENGDEKVENETKEELEIDDEKIEVEEKLEKTENVDEKGDDQMMQVDGNVSSSDEEYIPRKSQRREMNSSSSETESDDEETAKAKKKEAEKKLLPAWHRESLDKSIKKKAPIKAAKALETSLLQRKSDFDPKSVMGGRTVTKKSTIQDLVLDAVATLGNTQGVSGQKIKTHLAKKWGKTSTQHVNQYKKALQKLKDQGLIVNTSFGHGANGSFKVNPDFESFDTRAGYHEKDLDSVEACIEAVITRMCYEGKEFEKGEAEKAAEKHKVRKEPSTFQKLKSMYEQRMEEMSEAVELTEVYR